MLIKRIHSAALLLLIQILLPTSSLADDSVEFCNTGSVTMVVATANNYWRGGEELWKESGWYKIPENSCQVLRSVRPFHTVGYAFSFTDNRTEYNPIIKMGRSAGVSTFDTTEYPTAMCAESGEFAYHAKARVEVGKRCPSPFKLSFFIKGGNKANKFNILKIDPDKYLTPEHQISSTADTSKSSMPKNVNKLRHKYILSAYISQVYNPEKRGDTIRVDRIVLDDEQIAGTAEVNALHGLLRQNESYLECNYIGVKRKFKDKWELRDAMLDSYDYDDGYRAMNVTSYGRQLLDELAVKQQLKLANRSLSLPNIEINQECQPESLELSELSEGQKRILKENEAMPEPHRSQMKEVYLKAWGITLKE